MVNEILLINYCFQGEDWAGEWAVKGWRLGGEEGGVG